MSRSGPNGWLRDQLRQDFAPLNMMRRSSPASRSFVLARFCALRALHRDPPADRREPSTRSCVQLHSLLTPALLMGGDPVRVVYRCGAILDVPFASNGWGHAGARRPSGNAHGAFRRSGPMGAQLIGWPTTPTVRASCRRKSAIFTYVRRSRPWGSRIGTPCITRTRRTVLGSTDKAPPTATSDQPER